MRGGTANCTVVVSDREIASPVASSSEFVVAMKLSFDVKYQKMDQTRREAVHQFRPDFSKTAREDISVIEGPSTAWLMKWVTIAD